MLSDRSSDHASAFCGLDRLLTMLCGKFALNPDNAESGMLFIPVFAGTSGSVCRAELSLRSGLAPAAQAAAALREQYDDPAVIACNFKARYPRLSDERCQAMAKKICSKALILAGRCEALS